MNFACFALPDWGSGYLGALFACQKAVFWLSLLYHGNKSKLFGCFKALDVKIVTWQAVNS